MADKIFSWDKRGSDYNSNTGITYRPTSAGNGRWNQTYFNPDTNQYETINYSLDNADFKVAGPEGDVIKSSTDNIGSVGMKDVATGVNAVTGLANAFLGYKNYELAKDTLNFNKAAANRDIANQGLAYNTELDRRAGVDARLRGDTAEIRKQVADEYAAKKMNTSAIG